MTSSRFAPISVTDLARVTGGADPQAEAGDPTQLAPAAPEAQGGGMLQNAFASLLQNAAGSFGQSFGGQLGALAAQWIGRLIPSATA